jgi:hypothetical protein
VPGERGQVLRGAVPLVAPEPVAGIARVELDEHRVPCGLREDRGRRDRRDIAIAAHDGAHPARQGRAAIAVDPRLVGGERQRVECAAHRDERGLQDVEGVDLVHVGESDRPGESTLTDLGRQHGACVRGEELRVAQTANRRRRIEDHGGGNDRARQRTATRFVDASDQHRTPSTGDVARNSPTTASAASAPVSAASRSASCAKSVSSRCRVTVSS